MTYNTIIIKYQSLYRYKSLSLKKDVKVAYLLL